MSLLGLCNTTATVQRKTTAPSSMGGQTITWAAAYTDYPCTKQQPSGGTVERFAKRSILVSHVFYFPQAMTIRTGDRVVCGGENYPVTWVEDSGGRGRFTAVYTNKLD
jgi:hypothetical protein